MKELLLRLEGKLDAFILSHEIRHTAEMQADQAARGDPAGSPAGRALLNAMDELKSDARETALTVGSHDRTLQRVIGAMALVTTLGIGTLGLTILKVARIIP